MIVQEFETPRIVVSSSKLAEVEIEPAMAHSLQRTKADPPCPF